MGLGIDYSNGIPDARTLIAHTMALIGRRPAPVLMMAATADPPAAAADASAPAGMSEAELRAEFRSLNRAQRQHMTEDEYVLSQRRTEAQQRGEVPAWK